MRNLSFRVPGVLVMALLLTAGATAPASAQIGGLLKKAAAKVADTVDPSFLLGEGKQPITTSLDDAAFEVDSLDNFSHDRVNGRLLQIGLRGVGVRTFRGIAVDSLDNFFSSGRRSAAAVDSLDPFPVRSMMELQRTANGGFVMQPGYYEMHLQSYCLKAGTHGPGRGDGYLFAAPEGPAQEAVVTIVRNSVDHPEIAQQDIQVLLWAIIARAKFEDLDPSMQATAARLLSAQQLATLNRSALDLIPGPALERALDRVPPLVRQVLKAEAELRQALTTPGTSFERMERIAVLTGVPGVGEGSRPVPSGRWSKHPDGYYVRYNPQGYTNTVTEIWVPEGSAAVGKEFDPAMHIAVPGNTARQRLLQSARPYGSRS